MLARTYSRKGHKRSARAATETTSPEPSDRSVSPNPHRQHKKPKVDVEVAQPSPNRGETRHAQLRLEHVIHRSATVPSSKGTACESSDHLPGMSHGHRGRPYLRVMSRCYHPSSSLRSQTLYSVFSFSRGSQSDGTVTIMLRPTSSVMQCSKHRTVARSSHGWSGCELPGLTRISPGVST